MTSDDYSDIVPLLRQLATIPDANPEYERLREKIIVRCLPLARNIARRFYGRGAEPEDLIQVARLGLVKAVERFDAERSSEFLSFAVPTIMGEVRRYFRDYSGAIRVPRRLQELQVQIATATPDLTQRLGRSVTTSEIAAELGESFDDVAEAIAAGAACHVVSLDAPDNGTSDGAPGRWDRIGDSDERLQGVDDQQMLLPAIAELPERERVIMRLRFLEQQTQSQIAQRLQISQVHVSRLIDKALRTLRTQIKDQG
ncbi:SigB/SigF/SigG family RNA polymerase sigma factor [Hoyosella sp. YIM 151337]|uniref:SigB/SigF/SigG family RNA polymerase sigma factor n=1 Tax=Hoyosella sp. YIM 151337 TaxID=2992742 RepID=UPI00223650D8|nr:SigB/SigF/SigG family RNA polymerase sigma factor [Hoyosella sp. YIM 151337]MCW4353612.1 SigB/SigF/SigG family RNA polymerase sigma factor [Hoyosella sp. YIM 151337]